MIETSLITTLGFILTTLLTLWFFSKASGSKNAIYLLLGWMALTGYLGYTGFYRVQNVFPPRFMAMIAPGFIVILFMLFSKPGKRFSEKLDLKWLTMLHVVRIPVELVLYDLFLEGLVPDLMTFDGYNYDILSGISAPIVFYFAFSKNTMGKKGLLIWNIICLALLINILTIAVLSAQTPFQKLAFDQPNIGVTYLPFVWLPTLIVPIVLYSHLVSIRALLKK